ncbi:ParA family protein [Kroppenstedtia eburnea]|uniref:ParA family protein n=1 Tax=Kroppenstedtia eburnea TaxID=714067 RepID=UPI00362D2242
MGKVFAVLMNKGGVGKTSLLTNLAALLANRGERVLIVDTDGQGNASLAFGQVPNQHAYTVADVFLGKLKLDAVTVNLADGLDLAPANDDMNMLEFQVLTKLKTYPKPFQLLAPAIREARERYDYVLIDTPPAMGLVAGNVLAATDHLLIPFVPEVFGVQGFIRVIEAIREFEEQQGKATQIEGAVGMMVDQRTSLHREMMEQARDYCERNRIQFFDTLIPRSIRFASATAYARKPAVWVDKNNRLVDAYRKLLDEVIGE